MRYCKKCVQPDTRPGISFNDQGVCGACEYEQEIGTIDWGARQKELGDIAQWAKKTTKSVYDCVIGVSGGKDSTFQAVYARDSLGLRPLLVNSEPEGITEIGRRNIENLKALGFDLISVRPNPVVMKQLVRKCFYEYGNPAKITEYSLTASAYIIANEFKIPLLIQGENDAFVYGVTNSDLDADGNALNMNKLNTQSTPWKEFTGDGVTEKDLFLFHYDREKMIREGYKGVWLQYYVKEWSGWHNIHFALAHGLTIRPHDFNPYEIGTYSSYWQLDCDIWSMNNMLKYIKFGFGQCTDHACIDIRSALLTRQEGIELVRRYDGRCGDQYIHAFCNYIGIDAAEFWRVANTYRGAMWENQGNNGWILKDPIWEQDPVQEDIDASKLIRRLYPKVQNPKNKFSR